MSAYENIMDTEEVTRKEKSKRKTTPPRNKSRKKLNNHLLKFKDRLGKILFNLLVMIMAFVIIGYIGVLVGTLSNLILVSFYQYFVTFLGLFLFISFKIS
jgi:ABC-type multidrug transport system fused ATPase/permease subunit